MYTKKTKCKSLLLVLAIILTLGSCTKPHEVTEKPIIPADTISKNVMLPTIMKYCDGRLYVVDLFTEKLCVNIIDIARHKTICEFGQHGNGPGEFIHISSMDIYDAPDGKHLLLYDPAKKCLTDIAVNSILNGKKDFKTINIPKEENSSYSEIYKIKKGYIATGIFDNGKKYAILNDSLHRLRFEGEYLENKGKAKDLVKLAIANNGITAFNKDKSKFTEVVYMANEISFYKLDGDTPKKYSNYCIKSLNFDLVDGRINSKENIGYLSATYSKDNIFALYCGVPESKGIATYGKQVQVFDLDGQLQQKLILDKAAFQISVNEDGTKLFVLYHEPEPCIVEYDLDR